MAEKKVKRKSTEAARKKIGPSDEIAAGRRLKLEEGVSRDFDMPKEMAEEMSAAFSFADLAEKLRDKGESEARKAFDEFGRGVMQKVFELADGKYKDRTAEMIEVVAKQTGIRFPHQLQRYIELSVLSLRPQDKWNVTLSTTHELKFQEYGCALHAALSAAGINLEGLPCGASCIAGFIEAAKSLSLKMRVAHTAKLPEGCCEFTFYPL
ncbi:MAG: hypothetical protein C4520_15815 [Candidatus Abyssobacteria bacterium SURF_5]|uniref:L-2-amino-thiazoline-4-carboxylic acid hydrolase n=1 Tax=Abyssobacteria bacterium (strain SURF_5) TaxID=2093360 RepID=A0A3A4NKQ3_ABYX5|nr:MAG: hypothetical protein C4520_15815 [Candidatus Abyssubacteria bacterium SURF_5]